MLTYKQKKELQKLEQQKENFILFVQEMNLNTKFSTDNLIRKLRPYFKTSKVGGLLYLNFKNTKLFICIQPLSIIWGNKKLFEITCSVHPNRVFTLGANSHKELLLKIIKHEMI